MEKLYVNEIGPDGEVSTVGLFYSRAEAEKIVEMLRANSDRTESRYEITEAIRHVLAMNGRQRLPDGRKEKGS
jgi:hypothetical protein